MNSTNYLKTCIAMALTMLGVSLHSLGASSMPSNVPTRVICLAPSYTETMVAMQLEKHIVGITTSSDHVKAVKDADRVGLFMRPNLEKILSLEPDLVFASAYSGQRALIDKLRKLNIDVVILKMDEIDDIFEMVILMGKLFGQPERARILNARMAEVVSRIETGVKGVKRPRIYVEAGSDPLFTVGKGSFIHEMLEAAGAENIAGDMDTPYPRISSELVISRDPEIILLPYMAGTAVRKTVQSRSGWQVITAIKTGRIYDDLGTQTITIPSPRLVLEGLPELARRIHPELSKTLATNHNTRIRTNAANEKQ